MPMRGKKIWTIPFFDSFQLERFSVSICSILLFSYVQFFPVTLLTCPIFFFPSDLFDVGPWVVSKWAQIHKAVFESTSSTKDLKLEVMSNSTGSFKLNLMPIPRYTTLIKPLITNVSSN